MRGVLFAVYPQVVAVHGLFGLVALISFWLTALLRKGTPLHRRVGQTYLLAMSGICLTAMPMVAVFALRGRPVAAIFLAYLVLITATAMWLGRRAIRLRRDQRTFRNRTYAGMAWFNIGASLTVLAFGWQTQTALLMGFSLVGLLAGVPMLYRRTRPALQGNWWLREHYAAMIACGAATHVAFLAIGLDRLVRAGGMTMPAWLGLLAWLLPVAAAVIVTAWMDRRHRRPAPAGVAPAGAAAA